MAMLLCAIFGSWLLRAKQGQGVVASSRIKCP